MIFLDRIKSVVSNQRGIALLLVLSSLSVMTIAVIEFTYGQRINYRMAVQAKERLQAYYLAKSALNFSQILLKYNKETQKMASDNADKLGGMKVEPLYRMMPLSSSLLRSALGGELDALLGGGEGDEESEEGISDSGVDTKKVESDLGMLQKDEAEKFLDFDGDFSAEITEEQTKFDLNRFYGIETKSPAYDQRKKLLLSILMLPRFDKAFENSPNAREELVHSIADWIDGNDVINEFDQVQRGDEKSAYPPGVDVKSGKMLTLEELRLVQGMTDTIFEQLKPMVTVYSRSDKINICYAEDDLLKALVYHFTNNSGCAISSIKYDDEKMKELSELLLSSCPDAAAGAQAVEQALGLADAATDPATASAEGGSTSPKQPAETGGVDSGTTSGCQFKLKDLVFNDNKVFYVKAMGEVGDTALAIHSVLEDGGKNADFKVLYFKIE